MTHDVLEEAVLIAPKYMQGYSTVHMHGIESDYVSWHYGG